MTQNKKIAITGGIGGGKTAFCNILKSKGYPVFSCDQISKELRQEEHYLTAVKAAFPECFDHGTLNKNALANQIFTDRNAKKILESISHPLIMDRLFFQMKNHAVSFAEVPLLFENGYEEKFNEVIVILREQNARIASVMTRNGLTREEVLLRMESQYDYSRTNEKKYTVIENNGTLHDLERKAEEYLCIARL